MRWCSIKVYLLKIRECLPVYPAFDPKYNMGSANIKMGSLVQNHVLSQLKLMKPSRYQTK